MKDASGSQRWCWTVFTVWEASSHVAEGALRITSAAFALCKAEKRNKCVSNFGVLVFYVVFFISPCWRQRSLCNPFRISDIFWLSNTFSDLLIELDSNKQLNSCLCLCCIYCCKPLWFNVVYTLTFLMFDLSVVLPGMIPARGEVQITVTFTPVQYETSQVTIQVVISQFNAKPYLCTITGNSAPHLTLRYLHQQTSIPGLVDPLWWRFTGSIS